MPLQETFWATCFGMLIDLRAAGDYHAGKYEMILALPRENVETALHCPLF
jgi:hypothetical protein